MSNLKMLVIVIIFVMIITTVIIVVIFIFIVITIKSKAIRTWEGLVSLGARGEEREKGEEGF